MRLRQREVEPVEVLLGQLAAGVVQELHEGRRFLFEAPLQRALAHAKLARDLVASRLAVGQRRMNHLAHAVAGLAAVEMLEIVAGMRSWSAASVGLDVDMAWSARRVHRASC